MEIKSSSPRISNQVAQRATKTQASNETQKISALTNFRSTELEYIDASQHGPIAQLINDNYRAKISKGTRRLLSGKLLKEILAKQYGYKEFQRLPRSIKNLIRFDRNMSSAEVTKFIEFLSAEHQINFKDYKYDESKFRAVFDAKGELVDVEMQAGLNHFTPLSAAFELKKSIVSIFNKIKQRMILRKRQVQRSRKPVAN